MTNASAGREGSGFALFLDFDGTLVDIAPTPDAVVVDPALPPLLDRLRTRLDGALAVVTGRPLADVDRFLPGRGFDGSGMHGLELRVRGQTAAGAELPDISDEIERLRTRLAPHPGLLVEGKRVGVAVHWRLQPDAEAAARDALRDLVSRLGPAYRLQEGKAVCEIVPGGSDKGEAVRRLMTVSPYRGRIPVFVGDDRTDEHGFAVAGELGGMAVKVGPGMTEAAFRIASPARFREVLARWAEAGPTAEGLEAA